MLLLLAVAAVPQNPADDPGGWTTAKWGLTPEEVKALFPQATQIEVMTEQDKQNARETSRVLPREQQAVLPVRPPQLGLPKYLIDRRGYAVAFFFDKDTHLSSVRLIYQSTMITDDGTEVPLNCSSCVAAALAHKPIVPPTDIERIDPAVNERIVDNAKRSLLAALSEKYGNPTSHTPVPDGNTETYDWLFPTTKISLAWFHSEYKQLNNIYLEYSLRKKSSLL